MGKKLDTSATVLQAVFDPGAVALMSKRLQDAILTFGPTVADLQGQTFDHFINTQAMAQKSGSMVGWEYGSRIIEFMMKHGLTFTDKDPRNFFATSISTLGLSTSTHNRLRNNGVHWVELLVCITRRELGELRYLGPDRLNEVVEKLAKRRLSLAGE